ncbi:MAG: hypothetical protein JWP00_275 [Chloroflexi bacterium]|nr:hypothetical protein [Chloroflexota bacterium]
MPDESPPQKPNPEDKSSLAELLPDLFETPLTAQNSGKPLSPVSPAPDPFDLRQLSISGDDRPARSGRKEFNFVLLGLVAVAGLVVVPLVIFGVFIFIANSQPAPKTIDVVQATTPLVTVFSITPAPVKPTPAPASPSAARSPVAAACPTQTAFGGVELYSCSQPVQVTGSFSGYFGLAELHLAQNGQNGPGGGRLFVVTGDSPAKVLQFYAASLAAQGYAAVNEAASGTAPLGPYSVALYARGSQQIQVMALTVNQPSPDGQVRAGQTLIRLSSSSS